jgi:hypothetical protein
LEVGKVVGPLLHLYGGTFTLYSKDVFTFSEELFQLSGFGIT